MLGRPLERSSLLQLRDELLAKTPAVPFIQPVQWRLEIVLASQRALLPTIAATASLEAEAVAVPDESTGAIHFRVTWTLLQQTQQDGIDLGTNGAELLGFADRLQQDEAAGLQNVQIQIHALHQALRSRSRSTRRLRRPSAEAL